MKTLVKRVLWVALAAFLTTGASYAQTSMGEGGPQMTTGHRAPAGIVGFHEYAINREELAANEEELAPLEEVEIHLVALSSGALGVDFLNPLEEEVKFFDDLLFNFLVTRESQNKVLLLLKRDIHLVGVA